MDSTRLDHLSRALAAAPTRRGTLRALSALLLGGVLGRLTLEDAAAKKKGGKKGNDKKCPPCRKKKNGKCNKKKPDGTPCGTGKTCLSGKCQGVQGPTCSDGTKNGSETDIDCGGGTCSRCAAGQTCASRNDCASGLCAGTCQQCVNAGDCGTDTNGNMCACRDHESGQRFCTKNGPGDVRVLPAGTPCTACQGGEQCFPINGGAGGIECILPCGA